MCTCTRYILSLCTHIYFCVGPESLFLPTHAFSMGLVSFIENKIFGILKYLCKKTEAWPGQNVNAEYISPPLIQRASYSFYANHFLEHVLVRVLRRNGTTGWVEVDRASSACITTWKRSFTRNWLMQSWRLRSAKTFSRQAEGQIADGIVLVQNPAGLRPPNSQCFSLSPEAGKEWRLSSKHSSRRSFQLLVGGLRGSLFFLVQFFNWLNEVPSH